MSPRTAPWQSAPAIACMPLAGAREYVDSDVLPQLNGFGGQNATPDLSIGALQVS